MAESKRIEIPFKKEKLWLYFIGSVLFLILGIWIFNIKINESDSLNSFRQIELYFFGYIGLPFFSLASLFLLSRLLSKKPALILDSIGITDHSSGVSLGTVYWHDILHISREKFQKQDYIFIYVQNPGEYINKEHRFFRRKMIQANNQLTGTPLSIHTRALDISEEKLISLMMEFWHKSKPQPMRNDTETDEEK